MKRKIFVILLLTGLLAFIVYKMMQHESEIREQQVVTEYVEDVSGPLLDKKPLDELRNISLTADYYFRTGGDYFQMLDYGYQKDDPRWEPVLMKGVNIGFALPGKFPAEFSLSYKQYMDWFRKIGKMNANVIRVYTILPPLFYEAFAQYNLTHQDKPLYLLHGVWATEPPEDDYKDETYTRALKQEIIDAIDVLHGNAVLKPQRGKASGVYAVDVSQYVAGLILGREWEPNAVHNTNREHETDYYYGDFISLPHGNAMETWLAEMMDFTVLYETQTYEMQHPVSFVNWLPLDPMYHNTEIIENEKVREYDNDLEAVHFNNFHSSELFDPGLFASYHAYPYYPDYVYLKEKYATAHNQDSVNDNYYGYLQDLKSQTKGMPLVIAEYGVPSSRGTSHVTPFGFDQGGHSEAKHAQISTQLTEDIFHTGCAGAVFFEWIDEWFKHNWLVMDFEKPFEDRKLWHNMENPEQNFGIMAMESRQRTIDGDFSDWNNDWRTFDDMDVQFHADPGYLYLALESETFDFDKHNLYIAIDTYDKKKGDHRLPFTDKHFERGFEFLLEFYHPDSANILVDEPYSVFTDIYNDSVPVYASKPNENGKFVMQELLTNRGRVSLTNETFDSVVVNRSSLQHGKSNEPQTSNADWYWNEKSGQMEVRLTWHLLNVSDPAKHFVLDDKPGTDKIEYSKTENFRFKFFITDKQNKDVREIPENDYVRYLWEGWKMPEWTSRLKPIYDSLQNYFRMVKVEDVKENAFTKDIPSEEVFEICEYYDDHEGAVSVNFQGADYSQLDMGLPVLKKYNVNASFGVIPGFIDEAAGRYSLDEAGSRRRLTVKNIKQLADKGNSFILQPQNMNNTKEEYLELKQKTGIEVHCLLAGRSPEKKPSAIKFVRKKEAGKFNYDGIDYRNISGNEKTMKALDSIFEANPDQWIVLNYNYLTEDTTRERQKEYFIDQKQFEWQLRLARNHNYWLANEWDVFRYRKEKNESKIDITTYNDQLFFKVENDLDKEIFNVPLTICYETKAPYIRISSEEKEYTLNNRTGKVYFHIVPGNEVTLKKIW
ncbi:MAG: hypothetical protein K9I29_00385 [Bacteroidales bacterium]|nr:hypothetical protein [Bacteroidales bacterium]MCF8326723.1 hypothetical protein [Bacteroidales bacterium]